MQRNATTRAWQDNHCQQPRPRMLQTENKRRHLRSVVAETVMPNTAELWAHGPRKVSKSRCPQWKPPLCKAPPATSKRMNAPKHLASHDTLMSHPKFRQRTLHYKSKPHGMRGTVGSGKILAPNALWLGASAGGVIADGVSPGHHKSPTMITRSYKI